MQQTVKLETCVPRRIASGQDLPCLRRNGAASASQKPQARLPGVGPEPSRNCHGTSPGPSWGSACATQTTQPEGDYGLSLCGCAGSPRLYFEKSVISPYFAPIPIVLNPTLSSPSFHLQNLCSILYFIPFAFIFFVFQPHVTPKSRIPALFHLYFSLIPALFLLYFSPTPLFQPYFTFISPLFQPYFTFISPLHPYSSLISPLFLPYTLIPALFHLYFSPLFFP